MPVRVHTAAPAPTKLVKHSAPAGKLCNACGGRAIQPLWYNMPLDRRWEWSEVPWGQDDHSSQDFHTDKGGIKHIYLMGEAHPVCAPWWDTGIAPPG